MKYMLQKKGLSLIELTITMVIFSLFLMFMYATFAVGLKTWQIGAIRSELQQSAEVAMKRIVRDLTFTTITSLTIDSGGHIIVFETSVDPVSGEFIYDDNNGVPVWQGYVLYYTTGSPNNLVLFRRYIPRTDISKKPSSFPMAFPFSPGTYCEKGATLARNLDGINFQQSGSIITVRITYEKNINSNARVAIMEGKSSKTGTERFEITSSVETKN
ncbi:MAG: prepilin-type N-terminal cleavage/methylation domain-containing protein [Candidatus Eremiobacterota bacterium]